MKYRNRTATKGCKNVARWCRVKNVALPGPSLYL